MNLEFQVIIRPIGQTTEIDFVELEKYEQSSLILMLEKQLEALKNAPTQPSTELIQRQRFESLVLQVHHARQLFYAAHAKSLQPA